MAIKIPPKNSPVVSDGYVKYGEGAVDGLAIMQDFRDNEKNDFTFTKFVLGYSCRDLTFCFTFMVQLSCIVKYHKITQIQNGR